MPPIRAGQRTTHRPFAFPLALMLLASLSCPSTSEAQEPVATRGEIPERSSSTSITHVLKAETEFYTTGPQQARPPDGRFPAGTEVQLIRTAGSYALVRSADGVQAYVATGTLQPIQKEARAMSTDVRAVVEANSRFALDLYARLRADQPGNLFFSPGSLSTALAMTYAGAEGETASQMAKVLHFTLSQEKLPPAFASLNRTWKPEGNGRGFRLNVANRLWGQRGFDFLPGFLATTREHYGAELAQVDFVHQTEAARRQINTWVEEQTQGKIRDLIPPGVLDGLTRLVLTNAVYFKGDWSRPFDSKATQDAPFHVTAQRTLDVPLMFQQGRFRLWVGDGLKVLELPYGQGDLAMLVLLPDTIEGLSALESRLAADNLSRWQSSLREQEVRVYLPRFKLTSQFQLAATLKALGMTLAFSRDDADFSGMTGRPDLYVSAVVHKAFVDVNEEGTEAAAATGVVMSLRAAMVPQPPSVFRADHPFLFLIRDNRTGSILFLGRLVNPGD